MVVSIDIVIPTSWPTDYTRTKKHRQQNNLPPIRQTTTTRLSTVNITTAYDSPFTYPVQNLNFERSVISGHHNISLESEIPLSSLSLSDHTHLKRLRHTYGTYRLRHDWLLFTIPTPTVYDTPIYNLRYYCFTILYHYTAKSPTSQNPWEIGPPLIIIPLSRSRPQILTTSFTLSTNPTHPIPTSKTECDTQEAKSKDVSILRPRIHLQTRLPHFCPFLSLSQHDPDAMRRATDLADNSDGRVLWGV